jgi:hypothetical protein
MNPNPRAVSVLIVPVMFTLLKFDQLVLPNYYNTIIRGKCQKS